MKMQPIMTLNYQLSENDYLSAAGTAYPYKILSFLNVGGVIYVGVLNLLRATHILPDVSNGTISASEYGFYSLFSFLLSFFWLHQSFPRFSPTKRWAIARTWKRTVQMQRLINLSIAETGVDFQIEGFQDFRQWQHYTGFRETNKMFLLYYSESLYHILLKHLFSSPEQMGQFRDLLNKNNVAGKN
jgi:YcxB-like protein